MGKILLVSVFLLLHVLFCVLEGLALRKGMLPVRKYLFYPAVLMPFWGPLMVLLLGLEARRGKEEGKNVGVEKFLVESELYKGVSHDNARASGSTISMEEALIVNTPKERRALIMDVLNDDPKEYVEFLKKAGNNEDTEVVHYAVTAMVDISKENDYHLWQLEKRHAQAPEDLQILEEYCGFLWHCLEQGLMQGQVERMNRNLFDSVVRKKIRLDTPHLLDYTRCIQNCLTMGNFTQASLTLEEARAIWPWEEELLILQIHYAVAMSRGDLIRDLLRQIEEENIYLSAKAKEVIAFWEE